jgi:hypothetical protein
LAPLSPRGRLQTAPPRDQRREKTMGIITALLVARPHEWTMLSSLLCRTSATKSLSGSCSATIRRLGGRDLPPPPGPGPAPGPTLPTATEKVVQVGFTANRDELYSAWNAIANLADMAGKVQVSIRAECEAGFEKSKLQNGVLEPLREADLIE